MSSRMDKYKSDDLIPTRSDKNKELYKQVYNAYDEFENLIIPSNAREIDPRDLKKEITSRQDYRKQKDLEDITNTTTNVIIKNENKYEDDKKEDEVYDINELLNKAVEDKKQPELIGHTLSNDDYLKRLKLDNRKTNIEKVKEMYEDIKEETMMEDESLMKTANLSLEILSDLKGENDKTIVSAPIKEDEKPEELSDDDFYSNNYKFSKKDFVNREEELEEDDDIEDEDNNSSQGNGKFFFKILMLIFGIILLILVLLYFINYFNRV